MCDRERGCSEVPVPKVTTWQLSAGSAVIGLALAAGLIAATGPWDSGQRKAERDWAAARDRTGGAHHGSPAHPGGPAGPAPAPHAPGVLAALGSSAAPTGKGLGDALGHLMDDPALGPTAGGVVIDTVTGRTLYGSDAGRLMTPASTVKLATMAAGLSALGPGHRIATTVTATPDGKRVTLRGGGDPTLDRDGLRALADATAKVLRDRGVSSVRISYDTSLYSGPVLHPIGPNDNLAPVSALMTDEGRLGGGSGDSGGSGDPSDSSDSSSSGGSAGSPEEGDHGPAPRSGDPAGDTARTFASMLADRSVHSKGAPSPGKSPKGAKTVASTYSAPLSALVERALTNSDNDIAEAVARQTALAAHEPASFAGAGRAVRDRLKKLGLPLGGAHFADGSGLNRQDKVSPTLLATLLTRAGDPAHPELRPILTGLPIAGFTGTLDGRFTDPSGAGRAAGLIHAKTGTLTGVNTLAGTVVDTRGRLLAFAFMASDTASPTAAQSALDRLGTAVAACGCTG
ncbi:D-alanyl-D-alanine carboxypeptidase/D-alanyl-D-alanine-endopeptidase [Streptomyces sp. NBC_01306]|uniref:D-alanyl-D-alanine carboxypeptidase/D-alanyl-D-alanine endopeptidase n=1 Tax=Streptomyces sp. NBC_01306 TaxID=2903819 RepID=UPI0022518570|nr:D-alanyl-D-alanine carboxypeptidase/D-alanyl-D-alanine-endopeptidase [Streptomyces sp. NBC_01306]MCX4724812.1 D-alanyl-D-alanine carboxypeptidase/D-alanyl-D-alanine-endopeptidase [Streptomyces sp. NBC_01306]